MDDKTAIMKTALECQRAGRLDEAETIYRRVLDIDPTEADAMHLLGVVHHARGNFAEAIAGIQAAIRLRSGVADFHGNLAAALLADNRPNEAAEEAQYATELDPGLGDAHYNFGNALFAMGETDQAVRAFSAAIGTDERNDRYWANYLFALNFAPSADRELVYQANRRWGEALETAVLSGAPIDDFDNDLSTTRRLRLAYFLPELDSHVTPRFLSPMLDHHDRAKFEVLVYGYRNDGGPAPKNLFDPADRWIDVAGIGPAEIAAQMRRDRIDILAHPCTFKARYRTILAFRPAPVQLACINLVSTTGLAAADHLITNATLDPPGETDEWYIERLIRLSGLNVYRQPAPSPDVAALPATANDFVTFGSFNNPSKLTPQTIDLWADILMQVPGSRLLLKQRAFDSHNVQNRFSEMFQLKGVSADRLDYEGYTRDGADYLAAYNRIDIALDPTPFGGGTTSYESIWMGVPIVTLMGDSLMGRLSASHMTRVGHPEYVADTPESYIETAVRRASDIEALSNLRAGLREQAAGTIFNAAHFVREFDDALTQLWTAHCTEAGTH